MKIEPELGAGIFLGVGLIFLMGFICGKLI